MPFLGGSLSFERYHVAGFEETEFSPDHLQVLADHSASQVKPIAVDVPTAGFLGGKHLFDEEFDLGKNIVGDAAHFGVRIDTNSIPSAIKKAWLEIELVAAAAESPSGVISKAQKKEAREAVEQRCEDEAATGRYRKMKPFPLLWDHSHEVLYFGGSGGPAAEASMDLIERVFEVEISRFSAGRIATTWGSETEQLHLIDDVQPSLFPVDFPYSDVAWANEHSQSPDFLGNEFLLWLWWSLATDSSVITTEAGAEIDVILNKTLALECPRGESGKETITAEYPTELPEARQAIRSGKLPRKAGMSLVHDGRQFDLVLQAETFAISGAKIHVDDDEEFEESDRVEAIRTLTEAVDTLFHTFCQRRVSERWNADVTAIREWIGADAAASLAAA